MNNIMDSIETLWEKASLFEREQFLTRTCAELAVALCEAKDAQGLEVLRNNLASLSEFAEAMTFELEIRQRRSAIVDDFKAASKIFASGSFSEELADKLDILSERVREFARSVPPSEEELEAADEDACSNIKALIEREALAVNA